jgi:hypothetical protein
VAEIDFFGRLFVKRQIKYLVLIYTVRYYQELGIESSQVPTREVETECFGLHWRVWVFKLIIASLRNPLHNLYLLSI